MDIIERAYKPQNKADKIKSIYMQHYDDIVRLLNTTIKWPTRYGSFKLLYVPYYMAYIK